MLDGRNAMPETQSQVSRMFRALADPIRLRILAVLEDGELCVGDLVSVLKLPQPTVSRHLAYLRRSGLVRVRKSGPWAHYTLTAANSAIHQSLLGCLACCSEDVAELKADVARAVTVRAKATANAATIGASDGLASPATP